MLLSQAVSLVWVDNCRGGVLMDCDGPILRMAFCSSNDDLLCFCLCRPSPSELVACRRWRDQVEIVRRRMKCSSEKGRKGTHATSSSSRVDAEWTPSIQSKLAQARKKGTDIFFDLQAKVARDV